MSFFTALSLSLNNLMTKKGRTILTAFAGSIGIIGIALILSLSNGVQEYIKRVEEDTLSSYPLSIQKTTVDTTDMIMSLMGENRDTTNQKEGRVYSNNIMTDMISSLANDMRTNNLRDFKKFLDKNGNNIKDYVSDIKYGYNLNINLYKENYEDKIVQVNPSTVFENLGMEGMGTEYAFGAGEVNSWTELSDNKELLKSQYDLVKGSWPKKYNEVVLVVDENDQVSDYALYSLGLLDQDELKKMFKSIVDGKPIESKRTSYDYDDIVGLKFKLVFNTDYYEKQNGKNVGSSGSDHDLYEKNPFKIRRYKSSRNNSC